MNTGQKIRAARKAAGLTQAELASRLGVPQSVISDWENEKLKSFVDHAAAIHRALKIPLDVLLRSSPISPVRGIEVVGMVQAGVWRNAVEWPPEERTLLPVVGVNGYEGARLSGLKVAGASMDLLYPDGSYVIVVSSEDTDVRHGDRVVVYRAKGELTEASLKEVRVDADGRVGLWPRSSSPEHQEPIYLEPGDQDGPEIAYVVVGRFSMEDRPAPAIQLRKRAR
jgi:transcriptional regulator with XRE-family HTH domain